MKKKSFLKSSSLFIDTGGTFTDALATDAEGNIIERVKVLSSSSLRETAKIANTTAIEIKFDDNFTSAEIFLKVNRTALPACRKKR